jgi:hypothetical protein
VQALVEQVVKGGEVAAVRILRADGFCHDYDRALEVEHVRRMTHHARSGVLLVGQVVAGGRHEDW